MSRLLPLAVILAASLAGCATGTSSAEARYSVLPQVQVNVKGEKKKTAQANYRVAPDEAALTGSGGSR